eukprot:331401_1
MDRCVILITLIHIVYANIWMQQTVTCGDTINNYFNTSNPYFYHVYSFTINRSITLNIHTCNSPSDIQVDVTDSYGTYISDQWCAGGDSCGVCFIHNTPVHDIENYTMPIHDFQQDYLIYIYPFQTGYYQVDIECHSFDTSLYSIDYIPNKYPSILFGFQTPPSSQTDGVTYATVIMTLYWHNQRYQCNVWPTNLGTQYLCDTSDETTLQCNESLNPISYGLQIDNEHSDAVEIDKIIIKYMHNESAITDTFVDYFCFNITQQQQDTFIVQHRCINALHGGYDFLEIDTDETFIPYQLFLLPNNIIFDYSNAVNVDMESYVNNQLRSAVCTPKLTQNMQKYQLIARLRNAQQDTFSAHIRNIGNENVDNIEANTYSIIGKIGDIIITNPELYQDEYGKYQFKLIYQNADTTNYVIEFKQSSWIEESQIDGYEPINIPNQTMLDSECGYFKGLCLGVKQSSYIDGNDGYNEWQCDIDWNSIGTIETKNINNYEGIPAFNWKIAYSSSLFILKQSTFNPTHNPTATPSLAPVIVASINPTIANNKSNNDQTVGIIIENESIIIILGVSFVVVCCFLPLCIGIIICYCLYTKKMKNNSVKTD